MEPPETWGRWCYRDVMHELVTTHRGREYAIDLDTCVDATEVLDWILYLAKKPWTTAADIGDLVAALHAPVLIPVK
jgi:hypothetical protein